VRNAGPHGFGNAVRAGLRQFSGDAVAIMMATNRFAQDLITYYRCMGARRGMRLRVAIYRRRTSPLTIPSIS